MYFLGNEYKDTFHINIYNNFFNRNPDQLIMGTYNIEENKAVPPFHQKDLLYYGVRDETGLKAGVLCNINMQKTQLTYYLGSKYEYLDSCCEILLMFINAVKNPIQIGFNLEKFVTADLKKRGFNNIMGSCKEKKYIVFKKLGYKIIEEVQSDNLKELILMKCI
jgi:hypothetical protein